MGSILSCARGIKNQQYSFGISGETNDQAAANYRPKVYPGRITQFRPMKEYAWHENTEMAWESLATEGVEVHKLPVYPAGMLVEPFVEMLAAELMACISKAVDKCCLYHGRKVNKQQV